MFRRFCFGVTLLIFICTYNGVYSDPCTSYTSFDAERKRSVNYTLSKDDSVLCDNLLEPRWYRINSSVGDDLSTKCPPLDRCGSYNALWMNGTIPGVNDGIINASVCMSNIFTCCDSTLQIQVKNCGDYRVYNLQPSKSCPEAYCVASNDSAYLPFSKSTALPTRRTTTPPISTTRSTSPLMSTRKTATSKPPPDPCYHYIDFQDRTTSVTTGYEGMFRCDSELETAWYRFSVGSNLATRCLPHNRCGTRNPVWLAGSIPTEFEGEVTRRVCAATADSCCHKDWYIRVKNCSSYNVYRLTPTEDCPYAYCTGSDGLRTVAPEPTTRDSVRKKTTMKKNEQSITTRGFIKTTTNNVKDKEHSLTLQYGHYDRLTVIALTCLLCVILVLTIGAVIIIIRRRRTGQLKLQGSQDENIKQKIMYISSWPPKYSLYE